MFKYISINNKQEMGQCGQLYNKIKGKKWVNLWVRRNVLGGCPWQGSSDIPNSVRACEREIWGMLTFIPLCLEKFGFYGTPRASPLPWRNY